MNTSKTTKQSMLDTVTLKLKYPSFRVNDPNLFHPAFVIRANEVSQNFGSRAYVKYTYNPPAMYKADGTFPRFTGYKRLEDGQWNYYLHIEVSLPNLLFGNSVKELRDDNIESLFYSLQNKLQVMGIYVSREHLENADVINAHFGKNMPLNPPLTARAVIAELAKSDMGKRKDIIHRHYDNSGQALYFYSTASNIIFYDKKRDPNISRNRAMNKLRTKQDKQISEEMGEVLRFEFRITTPRSINSFIGKATGQKTQNITFKQILSEKLCQKVLLLCWSEIVDNPVSQLALKMEVLPEDIWGLLVNSVSASDKKKAHSLNKVLSGFGLYYLVRFIGSRRVRDTIEQGWSEKTWKRTNEHIQENAALLKNIPPSNSITIIQKALDNFERYDWKPTEELD